jgi:hypothetical protein
MFEIGLNCICGFSSIYYSHLFKLLRARNILGDSELILKEISGK